MISIRSARQDEADLLAEIGLRAWAGAISPVGGTPEMVENARRAFLNFTHSSWITITVIEKAGVPVGWCARENLDEEITDFWIDPDHQRQGLGTLLLEQMERDVAHQGLEEMRLETHARNEQALNFFEKRGYSVRWFTVSYNPKLDQDVQTVGLSRQFAQPEGPPAYGEEF